MPAITLSHRTAVVTGAAKGIGYAIAQRLLLSGAAVCLWDMTPAPLASAAQRLGSLGCVQTSTVDVTDPAAVQAAVQETLARLGQIDILVNNAGISGPNHPVWEYPLEAWRQVIEVNLLGTFYCCHAVVPVMLRNGYGRIINIASIAGKEGNPQASAYSASKAGVIGLTKSLGKELAGQGILVNCVTPAAVETDLFQQMTPAHIQYMLSRIPLGRFGQPEEIAALVAWLASEDCSFSTGGVFDISGGRATY
ncbi:MAG: SDR family NAD(P)-dependent oxidoreductase [Candidatus Tectimicrobiota bacterium]